MVTVPSPRTNLPKVSGELAVKLCAHPVDAAATVHARANETKTRWLFKAVFPYEYRLGETACNTFNRQEKHGGGSERPPVSALAQQPNTPRTKLRLVVFDRYYDRTAVNTRRLVCSYCQLPTHVDGLRATNAQRAGGYIAACRV